MQVVSCEYWDILKKTSFEENRTANDSFCKQFWNISFVMFWFYV